MSLGSPFEINLFLSDSQRCLGLLYLSLGVPGWEISFYFSPGSGNRQTYRRVEGEVRDEEGSGWLATQFDYYRCGVLFLWKGTNTTIYLIMIF